MTSCKHTSRLGLLHGRREEALGCLNIRIRPAIFSRCGLSGKRGHHNSCIVSLGRHCRTCRTCASTCSEQLLHDMEANPHVCDTASHSNQKPAYATVCSHASVPTAAFQTLLNEAGVCQDQPYKGRRKKCFPAKDQKIEVQGVQQAPPLLADLSTTTSKMARRRSRLRGVVMNPVDHPHGGAERHAPIDYGAPEATLEAAESSPRHMPRPLRCRSWESMV